MLEVHMFCEEKMPLPHFIKMFLSYMLATQALTQDTWTFHDNNILCVVVRVGI